MECISIMYFLKMRKGFPHMEFKIETHHSKFKNTVELRKLKKVAIFPFNLSIFYCRSKASKLIKVKKKITVTFNRNTYLI